MDNVLKVEAGQPHRMQISPFGVYLKRHADGSTTQQVCDEAAFKQVLTAWRQAHCPKILLDWDHDKAHTEAAGWIVGLEIDPAQGLIGMVEFTPAGAESVNDKEYRFLSPDWDVADDDHRPIFLRSVGMTNRPNIPVTPILNSTETDSAKSAATQTLTKEKPKMEKIALALGLDAAATEADIVAKIAELNAAIAAAQDAAVTAEATSVATENSTRIENSEAFIAAYKVNPAAVKAALATLKAAPLTKRVTNSEEATAPSFGKPSQFKDKAAARAALAEQPIGTRQAFYNTHKREIDG